MRLGGSLALPISAGFEFFQLLGGTGVRGHLSLNDAILSASRISSPESMKLMIPPY